MKIALLGGNSYSYANAPSYVHANGRGYITQKDLMGATEADDSSVSPIMAAAIEDDLKSRGQPVPDDIAKLAKQYRTGNVVSVAGQGLSLGQQIMDMFKPKPAITDPNAGRSVDNTAVIIIGGVAAVAVISVILSSKKKSSRA